MKRGLTVKPWVKTSLAPGIQVVTDYLAKAGLQKDLDTLGFNLVGYGCTTCIGNSGPLPEAISQAITENDLVAAAVLSGNRNFEGRVNPDVRANYLASPPLVVAYALAGSVNVDLTTEPLGIGTDGKPVYLKDIWPSPKEIADDRAQGGDAARCSSSATPTSSSGDAGMAARSAVKGGQTYGWDTRSTYVQNPPYFDGMTLTPVAGHRRQGRAHPRPVRRFHHHRPHLARRHHQARQPRPATI